MKDQKKILVTGHLGFIGFHVAKSLLEDGYSIMGIDSLNSYYSKRLKISRGQILKRINPSYESKILDLADKKTLKEIRAFSPDIIINMRQAGVRHSLKNLKTIFITI